MTELKIYRSIDAIRMMGILCAKASVDHYIGNMFKDNLFKSSYKLGNRWHITETDILYIRELIMSGKYKPTVKYKKAA